MLKKYFPYIILIAAAILLWYIKSHQRGSKTTTQNTEQRNVRETIPAVTTNTNDYGELNRHPLKLIYSKHARCRMDCRHIDESEVEEILDEGTINYNKIEKSDKGKSYPLEGVTHDKQRVRIVFAPKKENLVVVTVIDLDKDWYCDCK